MKGTDGDGNALAAYQMKAGDDVLLDVGFSVAGAIYLVDADIGGALRCSGAQLNAANSEGCVLAADRVKARGDVHLDGTSTADDAVQPFSAAGTVRLGSACVGGSLFLEQAKLAGQNTTALDARGAQVTHKLVWAPSAQVVGTVRL